MKFIRLTILTLGTVMATIMPNVHAMFSPQKIQPANTAAPCPIKNLTARDLLHILSYLHNDKDKARAAAACKTFNRNIGSILVQEIGTLKTTQLLHKRTTPSLWKRFITSAQSVKNYLQNNLISRFQRIAPRVQWLTRQLLHAYAQIWRQYPTLFCMAHLMLSAHILRLLLPVPASSPEMPHSLPYDYTTNQQEMLMPFTCSVDASPDNTVKQIINHPSFLNFINNQMNNVVNCPLFREESFSNDCFDKDSTLMASIQSLEASTDSYAKTLYQLTHQH